MIKPAVLGGGVVAMAMALALKKRAYPVVLWRSKQMPKADENQRAFALNKQAINLLTELGIDLPAGDMTRVDKMLIWDELSAASLALYEQGCLAHIVHEHVLWQALYHQLVLAGIEIKEFDDIQQIEHLPHGFALEGHSVDFLCVADGAQSAMRQRLSVVCEQYSYHQTALVAKLSSTKAHQHTAYQVFTPHGPLAFLPIQDAYQYSMVWSLDTEIAQQTLELEGCDLQKKISQVADGQIGEILSIEGLKSYPLHMLNAQSYIAKDYILLGDAAHHFHPLAGLGLNAGLGDVRCFLDLLGKYPFGPGLLKRYQRQRRAQLLPLIYFLNWIKRSFAQQESWWVKCRAMGIDILNQSKLLKKFMRYCVQEI